MGEEGDRFGLIAKNEDTDNNYSYSAYLWNNRQRRYFITSTFSLQEGRPQVQEQWRQFVPDLSTPLERLEIVITQPVATEIYYDCCGAIGQHNRDRQATLGLKRKFKTHD
jgi:hypothetical protein